MYFKNWFTGRLESYIKLHDTYRCHHSAVSIVKLEAKHSKQKKYIPLYSKLLVG